MNSNGWKAKQMQWKEGALYVLWERKEQNNE